MAPKKEAAALAVAPQSDADDSMILASALDGFEFGDTDGLDEVGKEDIRLPVIVWNLKGVDEETGNMRQLNEFFDTLNTTTYRELRCAFVQLHKTNLFARFDNATNENVIHCSSHDRIVGKLRTDHPDLDYREGVERNCDKCEDKQWRRNEKGANVRNCDDVYNVFAVHLDEQMRPGEGFLIRFKRTGLGPFKTYLQKHHLGKLARPNGQRGNVPLFAFEAVLRLEVAKNGNYATPVITRARVLPKEVIQALSDAAKGFADVGSAATEAAERQEQRHEGADGSATNGSAGASNLSGSDFVD